MSSRPPNKLNNTEGEKNWHGNQSGSQNQLWNAHGSQTEEWRPQHNPWGYNYFQNTRTGQFQVRSPDFGGESSRQDTTLQSLENMELHLTPKGTNLDFARSRRANNNFKANCGYNEQQQQVSGPSLAEPLNPLPEQPISMTVDAGEGFFNRKRSRSEVPAETDTSQPKPKHPRIDEPLKNDQCSLCLGIVPDLGAHLRVYHQITQLVCLKPLGHESEDPEKPETKYKLACYHCFREFQSTVELRKCRASHGISYCNLCPFSAKDEYDLMEHTRKLHNIKVEFKCKLQDCVVKNSTKKLLLQHQRRVHHIATENEESQKELITCKTCKKEFKTQNNLQRHKDRGISNPSACVPPTEEVEVLPNLTPQMQPGQLPNNFTPQNGEMGNLQFEQSSSQNSTEGMIY